MLRIQSKELVAKDKEIERLKKDVERLKEKNTPKVNIDIIPTNMMTSGWSPTSSENPKISDVEPLKLEVDEKKGNELVKSMCEKLLANLIIEDYKIKKI